MPDEKDVAQQTLDSGPAIGTKYRHYKGGTYEVIDRALFENTLEPLVIYRSPKGTVWARTFEDWSAIVEIDGKTMARFTRIDV